MTKGLGKAAQAGAFVAMGCVGFIATAPAMAQEADQTSRVADVSVLGEQVKEEAESPKYTAELLDTPQTITILNETSLRQQNLLTLRDALTTIPGITFGAGEGGGGYGDSINLRGQSANNDLQIDGVRDSAQYNRSDTFNVEQIEVVNGANSVYAGSGSISGSINLVTKRPGPRDETVVSAGLGKADYARATIDSNMRVSDSVALRLNLMAHTSGLADRDFEESERWGFAPSITFGMNSRTRLTLQYQHQEDENTPVYGVPYYAVYGGLLPGADYGGYYGYMDTDYQEQTIDLATAIIEHQVSDAVSIRNLTRYSDIRSDILVNPPQGSFCLANRTLANATGAATPCTAAQATGFFYPSGPRGTTRLTDTSILYNQLDLTARFETFGLTHSLTAGVSASKEEYDLDSGNALRNPNGVTPNPTLPPINIADPHPIYGGPVNFVRSGVQTGETTNYGVYLFDTIAFGPQFELNGGLRYEQNDAEFRSDTVSTAGVVTPGAVQDSDDGLFSYRIGAVYKPIPNASLYAAYGNSTTPTSSSVRGGCGLASAQSLNVDPCGVEPQEAVNYEVGGKIDLADGALQLTASVFRNERTNYPVASNDPLLGNLQVLDGQSRVDGVTLGAAGRITPAWTIFANYTYLDSEVVQSISNYCQANPGGAFTPPGGTAITCPLTDAQAGNPLTNTPEHSGSLFTTYAFQNGLQIGYGITYQGDYLLSNQTGSPFYSADSYTTHRLYAAYEMSNGVAVQLNVNNLTEERYFTGIRNNGWATPGEGRSYVVTVSRAF